MTIAERISGSVPTGAPTVQSESPAEGRLVKYFAYGSNMLAERLKARVQAENPTPYTLASHGLQFHKRSSDGSGKCNVVFTGESFDFVRGILWDIPAEDIVKLDEHEGVGCGYLRCTCMFIIEAVRQEVLLYVAEEGHVNDALLPYKWYLDLVVAGAEQNELPHEYVFNLLAVRSTRDPRPDRKTRLEALEALRMHEESRAR